MGNNSSVRGRMSHIICALMADKMRSRFLDPAVKEMITVEWRVGSVGKIVFTVRLDGLPVQTLRPRSLQYGDLINMDEQIKEIDVFTTRTAAVIAVEHLGIEPEGGL